jgi:hypothetical protein
MSVMGSQWWSAHPSGAHIPCLIYNFIAVVYKSFKTSPLPTSLDLSSSLLLSHFAQFLLASS